MWWLLFILLLPGAHAAGIDSGTTSISMDDGFVHVTETYFIESKGVEGLSISVPRDASQIVAEMDKKERTCKIVNSTAHCGSTKSGSHVFTIKYQSKELLGNLDERVVVKFNKRLPFKAKEHEFILKLPVGYIIPQELGRDPDFYLTPKPEEVTSDGQRIIITWKEREVEQVSVAAVTEPLNASDSSYLVAIILIAAGIGAGTAWYVIRDKKVKSKPKSTKPKRKPKKNIKKEEAKEVPKKEILPLQNIEPIVPQFIENEQKVVDLLKSAPENFLWQKQILQETGFSKAKLSRVIRNLEQRNVVVKEIFGNTNKIALKNEVKEESGKSEVVKQG